MASRQPNARTEARLAWCETRRLGDHTAQFDPGEELRCPASRQLSRGGIVVCGYALGWAKRNSRVTVRVISGRSGPVPHAGTEIPCPSCGAGLEIFPTLEVTR